MRSVIVLRINSYAYLQLAAVNKYRSRPKFILMHTAKKVQLKNYYKLTSVLLSLFSLSKYLLNTQYMQRAIVDQKEIQNRISRIICH